MQLSLNILFKTWLLPYPCVVAATILGSQDDTVCQEELLLYGHVPVLRHLEHK